MMPAPQSDFYCLRLMLYFTGRTCEFMSLQGQKKGALQNELYEKQRIGQPERVGRFFILR